MNSLKYIRDENRKKCRDYLGGACVRCNSKSNLHFDHVIPSTKSYTLATNFHRPFTELVGELRKCQLLCSKCHLLKTLKERPVAAHGSLGKYNNHRCRCQPCKDAKASWMRAYMKKRKFVTI